MQIFKMPEGDGYGVLVWYNPGVVGCAEICLDAEQPKGWEPITLWVDERIFGLNEEERFAALSVLATYRLAPEEPADYEYLN